jgi:hypothetical protein
LTEDGSAVEGFCKYDHKFLNPVRGWYISERLSDLPAFLEKKPAGTRITCYLQVNPYSEYSMSDKQGCPYTNI